MKRYTAQSVRENVSRAARLLGWFHKVKESGSYGNPRRKREKNVPDDYFDPRKWSMHAQVSKIYESMVTRETGAPSFRSLDRKQMRLDALMVQKARIDVDLIKKEFRTIMGRAFGVVMKRGRFVISGTNQPTEEAVEISRLRYAGKYVGEDRKKRDLTDLVNGRQSYEEMLGLVSAGERGFYRVTLEPTKSGLRYFVWPMEPGQRIPGPATANREEAQNLSDELNLHADPRMTRRWHVPDCDYTKRELAYWLPTDDVF